MRLGALLLAALALLQDAELEAARKADRERIASRPAVDPTAFRRVDPPAPGRPRIFRMAVRPLSFPDAEFPAVDLEAKLVRPLARFYAAQSGGALKLEARILEAARLETSREALSREAAGSEAERKILAGAVPAEVEAEAWIFIVPGSLGARGTALWPHQSELESKRRYVLIPLEGDHRWEGIAAHETGHLFGLEDKYEDETAKVGRWCLMGTGYLGVSKDDPTPAPLCAVCRAAAGWSAPFAAEPGACVALADGAAVRVALQRDGPEALVVEARGRALLCWHVGGGKPIELAAAIDGISSDRLTPWSEPPFRSRTIGGRDAWLTEARRQDGRWCFRVSLEGTPTPLEELRRRRVGRELGR